MVDVADPLAPAPTSAQKRGRKRKCPTPSSDLPEAQQATRPKKRKLTRVIKWLEETPTDIMLEIMFYMKPIDILNLSYTSKSIRASLAAPEAKHIWVQARMNVPGLPPLPPDMSEWVYAAFVFQELCQMCGTRSGRRVELVGLRIRLCADCRRHHCITGEAARQILGEADLLQLVPAYNPYQFRWLDSKSARFLRQAVTKLHHRRFFITDNDMLASFDAEKRAYVISLKSSSEAIQRFFNKTHGEAHRKSIAQFDERRDEFIARLRALGHDAADIMEIDFSSFASQTLKKSLAKCKWEQVRSKLEHLVDCNKKRRMDDQYSHRNNKKLRGVYRRIYGEQSTELARNTFLPVLDFLDLRSVRSFIPSYLPEEEFDLAVSMVLPTIREEAQAFCARMRSDLVRLWCRGNKYSRPAEEDDEWRSEFLSLAAVVFIPKGHEDCGSLIHYSTLFKRDIFLSAAFPARYDDSPEAHPTLSENWVDYLAGISYSHDHFQAMRKTLQTYFSDWDTTSLSDLDAQEGWKDKFYDIFDSR